MNKSFVSHQQPQTRRFIEIGLVHYMKKRGLLYQSLVSRGIRLSHCPSCQEKSNAEAHAMYMDKYLFKYLLKIDSTRDIIIHIPS